MGMHLSIPHHQFSDREAREHRTRVWWSAYILDRVCVSKLGHPTSVNDDDIHVELPSSEGLNELHKGDFGDAGYQLRHIELATLSTQIISSIYSRGRHQSAFSQRVQSSLKQLTKWMESLPRNLQLDACGEFQTPTNSIVCLHLTFNQVRTSLPLSRGISSLTSTVRNPCDAPHPPSRFAPPQRLLGRSLHRPQSLPPRRCPRPSRNLHPMLTTFIPPALRSMDQWFLGCIRLLQPAIPLLRRQ